MPTIYVTADDWDALTDLERSDALTAVGAPCARIDFSLHDDDDLG